MERYVEITEQEMDDYLQRSKGWEKNQCGYEYVYDYKLKSVPSVMIKVMSSINIGDGTSRNKGSDAIRVFAVKIDRQGKVIGGYIKKQRVNRVANWRGNLKAAFLSVRNQVYVRARKQGLL